MYPELLPILGKCRLFHQMDAGDIDGILRCLQPALSSFKQDELIVRQGESMPGIGIVVIGEAAVYKETAAGQRVLLTLIEPGGMFGEMAAFVPSPVWPATVAAQDDSTVLFVDPQAIGRTCGSNCKWHTQLTQNMLRILSEKGMLLSQRVEYLSIKSMRTKLCTFLLSQANDKNSRYVELSMNRTKLAEFLNVSRPSMSRELARLRDEGVLDYHLSTIKIRDRDALRKYAQ